MRLGVGATEHYKSALRLARRGVQDGLTAMTPACRALAAIDKRSHRSGSHSLLERQFEPSWEQPELLVGIQACALEKALGLLPTSRLSLAADPDESSEMFSCPLAIPGAVGGSKPSE